MYEKFETEISFEYIKKLEKELGKPLIVIGGWAIYFLVNKDFKKSEGRNYLGSKDLDLGYHFDKNMSKEELVKSKFTKDISKLKKLGFNAVGFRMVMYYDTETKKALTLEESKKIGMHNLVEVYIDPIVDEIPDNIKEVLGFTPIDEPYLRDVFKKEKIKISKNVVIPTPEIMLCMKLNSVVNRDKEHKKVKDICDIFALLLYTDIDIDKFYEMYPIEKARKTLRSLETKKAAELLNIDESTIKNIFGNV